MKLIRLENDRVRLVLGNHEKELLIGLLQLYPAVSAGRRKLTQDGGLPDQEASQALLDESLAETRAHHQEKIATWFTSARSVSETEHETRIVLSPEEVEILLQVLNDIRIGSWIALGSPETGMPRLNAENAPQLWAMQLSDSFLMDLLEGLEVITNVVERYAPGHSRHTAVVSQPAARDDGRTAGDGRRPLG